MSVSLFLVFKVVIKYTEIWGGKDIKKTVALCVALKNTYFWINQE